MSILTLDTISSCSFIKEKRPKGRLTKVWRIRLGDLATHWQPEA